MSPPTPRAAELDAARALCDPSSKIKSHRLRTTLISSDFPAPPGPQRRILICSGGIASRSCLACAAKYSSHSEQCDATRPKKSFCSSFKHTGRLPVARSLIALSTKATERGLPIAWSSARPLSLQGSHRMKAFDGSESCSPSTSGTAASTSLTYLKAFFWLAMDSVKFSLVQE